MTATLSEARQDIYGRFLAAWNLALLSAEGRVGTLAGGTYPAGTPIHLDDALLEQDGHGQIRPDSVAVSPDEVRLRIQDADLGAARYRSLGDYALPRLSLQVMQGDELAANVGDWAAVVGEAGSYAASTGADAEEPVDLTTAGTTRLATYDPAQPVTLTLRFSLAQPVVQFGLGPVFYASATPARYTQYQGRYAGEDVNVIAHQVPGEAVDAPQGTEEFPFWARFTIQHALPPPSPLGGAEEAGLGGARYVRSGFFTTQLFSRTERGDDPSYKLASIILSAFEGYRSPRGVVFRNGRVTEVGPDPGGGPWYQMNVLADFEYDTFRRARRT